MEYYQLLDLEYQNWVEFSKTLESNKDGKYAIIFNENARPSHQLVKNSFDVQSTMQIVATSDKLHDLEMYNNYKQLNMEMDYESENDSSN